MHRLKHLSECVNGHNAVQYNVEYIHRIERIKRKNKLEKIKQRKKGKDINYTDQVGGLLAQIGVLCANAALKQCACTVLWS